MDDNPSASVPIAARMGTPGAGEIALGLLPFVLLGAAVALNEAPFMRGARSDIIMFLAVGLFLGGYLLILAALFYAWLKEFPRWSMPYVGYGFIFGLYLTNVATPGLVIFGVPMWGGEPWGLRACVPVALVALLGFLFTRSPRKPLSRLFKNIWEDWTLLAYGLYGFLPLLLTILQDEMDHVYSLWPTIIAVCIVLAGAALYLIYSQKPYRAVFLLAGMFLSVLAVSIGTNFYWMTHSVDMQTFVVTPASGPAPWQSIVSSSISTAVFWTLFLLTTGLVGSLHYWVEKRKKRLMSL